MRRGFSMVHCVVLFGLAGCGGEAAPTTTTIAATTTSPASTTSSTSTTTTLVATTTTLAELSVAQQVYCEELTSVITVRNAVGGWKNRPETDTFMEIAYRLGYLNLPYTGPY
jgi:ABC-type uncharacterized transport system auxiliary subunit